MTSNEIRQAFVDFFRERGHAPIPSSPLVPGNDPTLLFTNAGMVQFKEVFLGREKRPAPRAVTVQRCLRAGGKHNDLENVGYTARHHTFFEMLGNFSFGDYFKRDAIRNAWEFLTRVLELPPERLWVTVFTDDDEAADLWLNDIGVAPERFSRCGEKDNFWQMGETGPCGPCSEIFYDHGAEFPGGPPGSPDADADRYIELWNLVFMQYDRDAAGRLTPLPRPSIDTGMGLERLAAVLQGVHDNYDIDLFRALTTAAVEAVGGGDPADASIKVIADHIRSCAFLAVDGVVPGNEGRGYVMRRIVRRAIRHGYKLGCDAPFFYRLAAPLAAEMGAAYPELIAAQRRVETILRREEERFAETLEQGMTLLETALAGLAGARVIPGETIFRLYDTYGFPVDLTADIARERGVTLDMEGYEAAMGRQRARARDAGRFRAALPEALAGEGSDQTPFFGYDALAGEAHIVRLFNAVGAAVESIEADAQEAEAAARCTILLDRTPFYAEAGGQVGDRGEIAAQGARFAVADVQRPAQGGAICHIGQLRAGRLAVGDAVRATVDRAARECAAGNHSATHLLHAALRATLGDHVQQRGSLVAPERLRFDFTHFEPLGDDQLRAIEQWVNAQLRRNHAVETVETTLEEARAAGAAALFGEKYGEEVRMVRMGDASLELCGGTHVRHTGEIGLLRIVSESGIAAGVRRIEALTGAAALAWIAQGEEKLTAVARLLKGDRADVEERAQRLLDRQRRLEREIGQLKRRLADGGVDALAARAEEVAGVQLLIAAVDGDADAADAKGLRAMVDRLKERLGTAAILLATVRDRRVLLVAGVTADAADRIRADALLRRAAEPLGGKGGGRAEMAQGGGENAEALPEALESARQWAGQTLERLS